MLECCTGAQKFLGVPGLGRNGWDSLARARAGESMKLVAQAFGVLVVLRTLYLSYGIGQAGEVLVQDGRETRIVTERRLQGSGSLGCLGCLGS